jgi:hypothetical protein
MTKIQYRGQPAYRIETLVKAKIEVIKGGEFKGESVVSESAIKIIFLDDEIIIDFGYDPCLHIENRYVDRLINLLTMHKKHIKSTLEAKEIHK